MASNQDRAQRWIDRALGKSDRDLGQSGTVFYSGDDIYSYGLHFCMATVIRDGRGNPSFVLVNGDRYSVTTSGHQSMVRRIITASGLPSIIVPFSALSAARIDMASIRPIHIRPDRNEEIPHSIPDGFDWGTYSLSEGTHRRAEEWTGRAHGHSVTRWHTTRRWDYNAHAAVECDEWSFYIDHSPAELRDGAWHWTTYRHWLGDSVFSAKVFGRDRRARFLSSFDYQERIPLYFLCELPRGRVQTVDDALQLLRPESVKMADAAGLDVTRQGDVFAIPTTLSTREVLALTPYGKGRIVKRPGVLGTNHEPSEVVFATRDRVYARGCLYHAPVGWGREPDHARRKMGDGRTWHLLTRNTVPRASGTLTTDWR